MLGNQKGWRVWGDECPLGAKCWEIRKDGGFGVGVMSVRWGPEGGGGFLASRTWEGEQVWRREGRERREKKA